MRWPWGEQLHSAQGKRLNNYELYQEFYRLLAQVACTLVQVRGHQPAAHKERKEQFFTLVDRASRQALRAEKEGPAIPARGTP